MYTKRNQRRQFLKLASGLLAAPLGSISSFATAQTSSQSPLRFISIVDHYGIPTSTRSDIWVRSSSGDYDLEADDLGTILQPLSAYRENMVLMSSSNLESMIQTGAQRSHAQFSTHTLTGSAPAGENRGRRPDANIPHASVDVRIGEHLNTGSLRAFPHLLFADYPSNDNPTYSFDTTGTVIRSQSDPSAAVDALFGSTNVASDPVAQTTLLARQNILDQVGDRVQALRSQLSDNASIQERLEAYDDSVDALATQLELVQTQTCDVPNDFDDFGDGGRNSPAGERDEMLRLIGQLFVCDMVSSVTYCFGGELINQHNYGFLDGGGDNDVQDLLGRNYHAPSHRNDDAANRVQELVRIHQAELTANLLDTLSNTIDVDGNPMIDNTVVYLPTAMAHNTHAPNNYALAAIAGRNTNLITGRHYDMGDETNNDILVTLAQGCNVPITEQGGYRENGNRVNSLNNGPIERMLKTTLG